MILVCGTSALMSGLGDVSTDAAAANKCTSWDWSTGAGTTADPTMPRRCYMCALTKNTAA